MTAYITPINECSVPLIRGRIIDESTESTPFEYTYDDPTGSPLFDYYSGDCLMSKRLVSVLEKAGVDNLQKFETELIDKNTKARRNDYYTVNIIGLVSCASIEESDTSKIGTSYYFHNLVIDPKKTKGILAFRLAESKIDLMIHENIAREIQANGFLGIELNPVSVRP